MKNWLSSLYISFTILTCIPLSFNKKINCSDENIARAASFFPLIGLLYGLVTAFIYYLVPFLIRDYDIIAFIILIIPYCINKFFHFDGLADTLDAFMADRTKEERLAIMKDSRTGSFALGGIVFFLLLKFMLIKKMLFLANPLPLFVIIPVFSRFGIVLLSFISNYAGKDGIGRGIIGRLNLSILLLASILTLLIASSIVLITGISRLMPFITGLLLTISAAFLMKYFSYKKIGGVTGDVLGAYLEVTELLIIILYWRIYAV